MKFTFFSNTAERLKTLSKKRSFRFGLPFLLFMFFGSFGLERFASLRYEFRRNETLKPENLEKYGIKKKKVVLQEELEKYKQLDINSWENIRGPRPWEEPQQQKPS
ncbi:cytochrome c oxidase assembly protein COX16 homolog, mitochondrial [Caerostris darwini]|uniref:Cytochrome c oxidase assembly protein COX16 homolog, mitochondrial n=1 Tax=Caerostris darwini TaxID=1538125 RepID=A0AAV4ST90_9ARAC|nr:cytochrome c oxidase assembly protein COX16 homolog, mitochondrial [Caerostris darwini]